MTLTSQLILTDFHAMKILLLVRLSCCVQESAGEFCWMFGDFYRDLGSKFPVLSQPGTL